MVGVDSRRDGIRLAVEEEGVQRLLLVLGSLVWLVDGGLLRKAVLVGHTLIPSPGLGSGVGAVFSVGMHRQMLLEGALGSR